ncbi:MAG: hypothetical protein PHT94_04560 [Candidatus Nanoarchaeia archaeon]|nr:hypothetical protein [Candidatus Nanoarchaeia archaeon]
MGVLIFLVIFVVCIIAGFNGMPLLLLFPGCSIILFLIVLFSNKNNTTNINIKNTKKGWVEYDEDIDDFIIYDNINHK